MAKAQKGKGDAFVEEAKALLAKKSWFSSGSRNAEDAAETYEKAANAYKVGGLNDEAGDAYMAAAETYRDKLSDFTNASKCLNNAGMCVVRLRRKKEKSTMRLFLTVKPQKSFFLKFSHNCFFFSSIIILGILF